MKILKDNSENLKNVSLILGFFDGIHLGHREVIKNGLKDTKSVLLTFKASPSEYFNKQAEYIYPRETSYKRIEELGVDCLIESDFADLVNISAEDYLKLIVEKYSPKYITTGFNYTFGQNKKGNNNLIKAGEIKYGYKYFSTPPYKTGDTVISSTYIKSLIRKGEINEVNRLLAEPYTITSTVKKGEQLGRKLGYPTANMDYPPKTVKLPFGVYKAEVYGKPAVLNWGTKPTVNGENEGLEVHISDFDENLYGKSLTVKILDKIRDEKKFDNLEDLKTQIKKDLEECLKLS